MYYLELMPPRLTADIRNRGLKQDLDSPLTATHCDPLQLPVFVLDCPLRSQRTSGPHSPLVCLITGVGGRVDAMTQRAL